MVVKIADPLLMREINKYHVLETIRCHGQISRVEISERTLLSGTTVSAITAALIDEGLIEAIHTATRNMGPAAGLEVGELRDGFLADLLVVDGDPTTDITVLQDPDRRRAVVKDGAIAWVNPRLYP